MRRRHPTILCHGWLCLALLLAACGTAAPAPVSNPTRQPPPALATSTPAPTRSNPTLTAAPTATSRPATPASVPAASPITSPTTMPTPSPSPAALPATPASALPGAPATGEVHVRIDDLTFLPGTITIAAGTTVVWTNDEPVIHTVAHDDLATFSSAILNQGDSFRFTFDRPGVYPYLCTIHPDMRGSVTVR